MRSRTKQKTSEKPAAPRKAAVAKLVQPPQADIDDDADDRQRGRRAVARPRLRDPRGGRASPRRHRACRTEQAGRPAQFHHVPSGQDHGVARLSAPGERDSKRYRVGRPLFALAASALDEIEMVNVATPDARGAVAGNRRKRPFRGAHGRRRRRDRPHQRPRRVPADRPRRRGAPGPLHRARQDHPGLAAPGSAEAFPRTRRDEAVDREVDHRRRRCCCARSPRSSAPASPSTTANSIRKCAASRCR